MSAILSDDPKAVEKLQEKLVKMEENREFMKAINKDFKQAKGDVGKMKVIPEHQRQKMIDMVEKAYSWEKQPYPSWKLTNLGANIRTVKKRIEKLSPIKVVEEPKEKKDHVDEAIKKHEAFFAFNQSQYAEQAKEGVKYISLGAGLIAPKDTHQELIKDLNNASVQTVLDDKAANTNKELIHRELANHEAQITGCIDSTVEALKAEDFITLLRECQLFSEHQIDDIAVDCKANTLGQVLKVCRDMDIGLNDIAITDLARRFINA
jgi:hypothetical protein